MIKTPDRQVLRVPHPSRWFNSRHDPDELDPELFSSEADERDLVPYLIRHDAAQEDEP